MSKIIRLASCMWGGMMCPIIPVMKKIPEPWKSQWDRSKPLDITKGYLRFFEPDVFVETARGQNRLLGLDGERFADRKRNRNLSSIIRKDHGLAADLDVGVNMFHVYGHLFKTEFQFQKREKPRIWDFKGGNPVSAAFFEAVCGGFPTGKVLDYMPHAYKQALDSETVKPSFEQWKELVEKGAGFPLYYTVRDMDKQFETRGDPTIFILDPLNPLDVIDFWNFRIFSRNVVPINSHWLDESRDMLFRRIRLNHQPLPTNPHGVTIHTAVHIGRSLDANEIIERLNIPAENLPAHSASFQNWYEPIWTHSRRRDWRPTAGVLSVKSRDVQIVPTESEPYPILSFPAQQPDFDVDFRGYGPAWVNVVRVRQYGAKKAIAETMPSAAVGKHDGYPTFHEEFLSREGYVTFQNYAHDSSYLHLSRRQQAIVAWLKTQDIIATPSEAGRIADQVIDAVGGLSGMPLLRERPVLELLNKMARSRKEWPDGSADEFQDSTAKVGTWSQMLDKIQKEVFGNWKTLDRYVAADVLRLGLTAPCSHCSKENWYGLDDVATTVPCSRCLKSFPFPQGNPKRKDAWKYRVIGPFATPNYAEGSYCVALTLWLLEHEISSLGVFTYSTGLDLDLKGKKLETDFFAWHNDNGLARSVSDPITFVGECKSLGKEAFQPKDIARLKALATAMPGAYIVCATLKDEFSAAEVKRLRSLVKWAWQKKHANPVILLTGIELFSHSPFSGAWTDAGGRRAEVFATHGYVHDYDAMAIVTQQALLNISAEDSRRMRFKDSFHPGIGVQQAAVGTDDEQAVLGDQPGDEG